MLKLIAGVLGGLFLYASYKLVTADGRGVVAPPDKAAPQKKAPAPSPGGVKGHTG